MDFSPSPAYYLRQYGQSGLPGFKLRVVQSGEPPERDGWVYARLTLDPESGPVLGTAVVRLRVDDEPYHDAVSGCPSTRAYTVCELETRATEAGHYLEIVPLMSGSSEIGKALVCRLSPFIEDAVREQQGEQPSRPKKRFPPLPVRSRTAELGPAVAPTGPRRSEKPFTWPGVGQARWDSQGCYLFRVDWSVY